jgi:2,3-diaminopropionate biosynthesis protein SbnA
MKVDYDLEASYFVHLREFVPAIVSVKIEGGSLSGSIKFKTAVGLLEAAERDGLIRSNTIIVESSSGGLGVALAMLCAQRGYRFHCIVDPNASPTNVQIIKSLGAEVVCVTDRDRNGGYLASRITYIERLIEADERFVWLNQYRNSAGPAIHERTTGPAILRALPDIDILYIGAGTTGTLMGCARFFRKARPETKIVAVDSVGSVTFGGASGERHVPGIGTSRAPEICDPRLVDEIVLIPESEGIAVCRQLARNYGLLLGGSSGSVLAAVRRTASDLPATTVIGALSPDFGERYLSTVYDDEWVSRTYGVGVAQKPPRVQPLMSTPGEICSGHNDACSSEMIGSPGAHFSRPTRDPQGARR